MNYRIVFPVTILVSAMILLQWHSIHFWMEHTGKMGFAWAMLLEGVALWCWSQQGKAIRFLGVLASTLALLGPAYQVSSPLVKEIYSAEWDSNQKSTYLSEQVEYRRNEQERLISRKDDLLKSLSVYQENSRVRPGWLPAIEKTMDELADVDRRLSEIDKPTNIEPLPEDKLSAAKKGVILMELLALVLFQVISVLAILAIAREVRALQGRVGNLETKENSEVTALPKSHAAVPLAAKNNQTKLAVPAVVTGVTESLPMQGNHNEMVGNSANEQVSLMVTAETEVDRVNELLSGYLSENSLSQSAFADKFGLSKKSLSFLRNHNQRVSNRMPTASEAFINDVKNILLTEISQE